MEGFDTGLLILRLGLGLVFLAHGVKHAMGREKTTAWFASIGFKNAPFQWFMSTATELVVGVLLILGLLTTFAAAGLIGVMAVAYWTVHRPAGFWITAFMKEGIDVEGWEYVFTLSFAALALAVTGPGDISLDSALGIHETLDAWIGLVIALGGILASAGMVVTFWRDPESAA